MRRENFGYAIRGHTGLLAIYRFQPECAALVEGCSPDGVFQHLPWDRVVVEVPGTEAVDFVTLLPPEAARIPQEAPVKEMGALRRDIDKAIRRFAPGDDAAAGQRPYVTVIISRQSV